MYYQVLFTSLFITSVAQAQDFEVAGDISAVVNNIDKIYFRYHNGTRMVQDSVVPQNNTYTITGSTDDHVMLQTTVAYKDKSIRPDYRNDYHVVHIVPGARARVRHGEIFSRSEVEGSAAHTQYKNIEPMLLKGDMQGIQAYVQGNPHSLLNVFLVEHFLLGPHINPPVHQRYFDMLTSEARNSPAGRRLAERFFLAGLVKPGNQTPGITQKDVHGKEIRLADFRGKFVLIDFWASWCKPCREQHPFLASLYKKFRGKNFEIWGISVDESKSNWQKAVKDDGIVWINTANLQKMEDNPAAMAFHLTGIPFSLLIDPDGKIVGYNLKGEALQRKLSEILAD